ncbi:hypothetical protein ACH79_26255 [Bradyrhizobium sp. CCBAU 051011]|uniref:CHAD domain-containing protein n=1 Tax=Bradyrhizobium sp. CCBAU 051011 TaxID=858422 RepID=UPI001373A9B8|nr:hypothetical protein ACH79_26255 [Bradyrhizobium sp. CCBAU 051011]
MTKVYRACVQLREEAYEKANAALSSQRFRTFLIDVSEWIETGNEERKARSRKGEPSAKDIASKTLSKTSREMMAIRQIDKLDLRCLHKLRLRAKRMRYTIEFTRGLCEVNPNRVEGMLKQLGKLQAVLGQLTDSEDDIEPNCWGGRSRPRECPKDHVLDLRASADCRAGIVLFRPEKHMTQVPDHKRVSRQRRLTGMME